MATPTVSVTATIWVPDDVAVKVSTHDHMACLFIGTALDPSRVMVHVDNEGSGDRAADRHADLTILRQLAVRMLAACDTAIAAMPAPVPVP